MTVVLVDPRRPSLVPVEAVELLTGEVQYTEEMPVAVPWTLPAARPAHTGDDAPVLLSSDPEHPSVTARLAAGERLISAPGRQRGERLVDAVTMMDKLRTAGPWESEQTHDSLRRFLLEETYELFDAVHSGDAEALREELGDVLLQVLFHARIAEDAPQHPFSIDDVAGALMRKLGNRVPGVLAGEPISLDEQLAQWEERKALEKRAKRPKSSAMDDVPTAQPALALAQKVIQRVSQAGLPADLIPAAITSITVAADVDVENALRTAVLEFMDAVRGTEKAIAAERRGEDIPEQLDVARLGVITEDEWRAYWPPAVHELVVEDEEQRDEPADERDEPADEIEQPEEQVDEPQDTADAPEDRADEPEDAAESAVDPGDDQPMEATVTTGGDALDESADEQEGDQPTTVEP